MNRLFVMLFCIVLALGGSGILNAGESKSVSSLTKFNTVAKKSTTPVKDEKKSSNPKDDTSAHKIDPVESAFALPRNAHLNGEQTRKYNDLKKKYETQLRDLLDKLAKETTESAKDALARKILHLRADIRDEINRILQIPIIQAAKEAQQRTAEAYKRYQARERAAEQAKWARRNRNRR